jgi:hypothetical protein
LQTDSRFTSFKQRIVGGLAEFNGLGSQTGEKEFTSFRMIFGSIPFGAAS